MITVPRMIDRPARPYAFITFTVALSEMARPAEEGFPALSEFLTRQGIEPIGAPFFNYRRIDMATTLEVEAGMEVTAAGTNDGTVQFGTLPGGRFVEVVNTGPYDELMDATSMLIGWAKEKGVTWDSHDEPDGEHFACRLEVYETDPTVEPDPAKWTTRLEFKTTDLR